MFTDFYQEFFWAFKLIISNFKVYQLLKVIVKITDHSKFQKNLSVNIGIKASKIKASKSNIKYVENWPKFWPP